MKPKLTFKPEDRMKAVILGGASVVALIVGGWNVLRVLQTRPRNAPPASVTHPATGQTPLATGQSAPTPQPTGTTTTAGVPTGIQPGVQASKQDLYAHDLPTPATTHDPFTPVVPLPFSNATRDIRAHTRPIMASAMPVVSSVDAGVPRGGRPRTRSIGASSQSGDFMDSTSVSQSSNVAEELTLGGVISGPSAVAVIRQGDHSYPLFTGQKLPNQMTLARITDTGIYLVSPTTTTSHLPGKTWFLGIGQPLHTAIPVHSASDLKASSKSSTLSR